MCMSEVGMGDVRTRFDGEDVFVLWRTPAEARMAWRSCELVASRSGVPNACWTCWSTEMNVPEDDSACHNRLNVERDTMLGGEECAL